jgi:hypothetical protein
MYESSCECRDYHGKDGFTEKNDPALPPTDPNAIQAVTPSDIFSWQGPTEPLTRNSGRIAAQQKWYRCGQDDGVELRAGVDGDLHIALQDATGNKPGIGIMAKMKSEINPKSY